MCMNQEALVFDIKIYSISMGCTSGLGSVHSKELNPIIVDNKDVLQIIYTHSENRVRAKVFLNLGPTLYYLNYVLKSNKTNTMYLLFS